MEQQMGEPQKPFACSLPDCGMTFTNEDHLNVHTKKHDMVLQLGMEQKAAFVADQTPTPTRFIRNCEEVGLFQDLHVNPFDEGFKRAMETKAGMLSLDSAMADDLLHTPQMVFPLTDADSTLFTSTNNQKNITISRSSSDETGAVKEYETTTISKLTNEVTTISRVIEKQDTVTSEDFTKHDEAKETSVSYTNNIIKIHSNVEIRKDQLLDANKAMPVIISYTDTLTKDTNVKDTLVIDKLNVPEKLPPIMSQKSIDFVVDSLVNETLNIEQKPATVKKNNKITEDNINEAKDNNTEDFEVIIKLPNKKYIKMKPVDELMEQTKTPTVTDKDNPKEKLKNILQNKANKAQNHIPGLPKLNTELVLPSGTLYPVTIMNTPGQILLTNNLKSIPIPISGNANKINDTKNNKISNSVKRVAYKIALPKNTGGVKLEPSTSHKDDAKVHLERRSAASKRYRARLKQTTELQKDENEKLKQSNKTLRAENVALKYIIVEHLKVCPTSSNLSNISEVLQQTMKQILENNEVL